MTDAQEKNLNNSSDNNERATRASEVENTPNGGLVSSGSTADPLPNKGDSVESCSASALGANSSDKNNNATASNNDNKNNTNNTNTDIDGDVEDDGKNPLHDKRDWYSTAATFVAGGVAGAASRTLTAPLDRVKIIVQEGYLVQGSHGVSLHSRKHARLIDVAKIIYKDGGWRGFWRGNLINCFKAGPEFAIVFSLRRYMSSLYDDCVEREQQRYNNFLRKKKKEFRESIAIRKRERTQREAMTGIHEDDDEDSHIPDALRKEWERELDIETSIFTPPFNQLGRLANVPRLLINCTIGAAAGVGAQSILYPMEVIKTRVIVSKNSEFSGGVTEIIREGYRKGGILDFYKGFTPNLVGIIVYRGLEMGIYSSLQQSIMLYRMQIKGMKKKQAALNTAEVGAVGMVASTIAQTVSYPLNVVRTRLQTQGTNGRAKMYKGTVDCIVKMVQTKGVHSLFSGLMANYLKAIPASSITFIVFEKVQSTLVGDE